jgi:transcriptional regulator with GAF, ATPase, and Fis domain
VSKEILLATIDQYYPHIFRDTKKFNISDPINYIEILKEMRRVTAEILDEDSNDELYISGSSGTPQMHACWVLLAAGGEIPARIVNIRELKHLTGKNRNRIEELDLTSNSIPMVKPNIISHDISGADSPDINIVLSQLGIIASHPKMRAVIERIAIVAPIDRSLLIVGETGTGKEMMARLIHMLSSRSSEKFIPLNCGAIPKDLVESTLFGHKKGAFTGAVSDMEGKFKAADGGTLFLDELGELPESVQVKLLRALETGDIEPVGISKPVKVDVRVIAATNVDLSAAIQKKLFREDLYHRIAKTVIMLPPLRERKTDIPTLAIEILNRISTQLRKSIKISPEALSKIQNHKWSGNVRELENKIENAAIFCKKNVIKPQDIDLSDFAISNEDNWSLPEPEEGFSIEQYTAKIRHELIQKALNKANGNQSTAAKLLGISPQAVSKFLKSRF